MVFTSLSKYVTRELFAFDDDIDADVGDDPNGCGGGTDRLASFVVKVVKIKYDTSDDINKMVNTIDFLEAIQWWRLLVTGVTS